MNSIDLHPFVYRPGTNAANQILSFQTGQSPKPAHNTGNRGRGVIELADKTLNHPFIQSGVRDVQGAETCVLEQLGIVPMPMTEFEQRIFKDLKNHGFAFASARELYEAGIFDPKIVSREQLISSLNEMERRLTWYRSVNNVGNKASRPSDFLELTETGTNLLAFVMQPGLTKFAQTILGIPHWQLAFDNLSCVLAEHIPECRTGGQRYGIRNEHLDLEASRMLKFALRPGKLNTNGIGITQISDDSFTGMPRYPGQGALYTNEDRYGPFEKSVSEYREKYPKPVNLAPFIPQEPYTVQFFLPNAVVHYGSNPASGARNSTITAKQGSVLTLWGGYHGIARFGETCKGGWTLPQLRELAVRAGLDKKQTEILLRNFLSPFNRINRGPRT